MWFWPTLQCVFLTLPSCVVFYLDVWYFTLLCDILPCCMVSDSPCYVVFDPDGLPLLTAWLDLWAQSHQIPGSHVHIQHLQELHIVYHVVGAVLTLWHHAINKTKLYTIQTITYFPGSSEYSWNNVASASWTGNSKTPCFLTDLLKWSSETGSTQLSMMDFILGMEI